MAAKETAERATRVATIRACADQLKSAGESASEAMAVLVGAIKIIKASTNTLHGAGVLRESHVTTGINLPIAVKSELITAGLLDATVPRLQRTTIAEMVGSYAASARRVALMLEADGADTDASTAADEVEEAA